jgi:hypothetical protein
MRSYLVSIARNLSYRAFRGQGRELLDDGKQALAMHSEALSPLDQLLANEQMSQVERALRSIPIASREPFVLFYLEDKAVGKVAADLDLSESAVKQRLYRARESLKSSVAEQLAAQITRARPALGAAVFALIVAQATKASAVTGAAATVVSTPSQIATQAPLSTLPQPVAAHSALFGAGVFAFVGKLGVVLAAAVLALVIYSQAKDADASSPAESAQAPEQEQLASDVDKSATEPERPSPSLQDSEEVSAPRVEGASEQPLITGRLLIHVEGADADEDGRLSEEEVDEVRRSQEELLLKLIEENWATEGKRVGCSTVGIDVDGVFEGGRAFIIDELRSAHAQDRKDGVDLTLQEWIASEVVANHREGSICYETRARYDDDVRQLKAAYKGKPVQWNVHSYSSSGESFFLSELPKQLGTELAALEDEGAAQELVDRWGIGISANRANSYFHARAIGLRDPLTLRRHPEIEAIAQEFEDERLAKLAEDENEGDLPQDTL